MLRLIKSHKTKGQPNEEFTEDGVSYRRNALGYAQSLHPCGHVCYPGRKPEEWCIECRYGDNPYH